MAESAVFSLASKILSTIASPAFEKAYERGLSIWEARDELAKLRVTIETIQAVLLDAETKQQSSASIKNWIKRLKGVLYDADDLSDEVATDDLLKQQIMEGNNKLSLKKKVWVSCSKLNPIVSRNSIAKKVKAIRMSLLDISTDMAQYEFVRGQHEETICGMRIGQDPGSFVDPKYVFGRDEDKNAILDMLFNESNDANPDAPVVVSIVGIGGMGKTTLAQLIYNDDKIKRKFESMWFVCISDTSDDKEVLGKIFQSICEESYSGFTVSHLQNKIRESIEGKNFLLVLDDVWDEDHGRWLNRMSLLGGGAKGSRIIVTTRSASVATSVDAFKTHTLGGLSEYDSWNLFKRVAFTHERENDPRWIDLGRDIVKKCANVPLAIKSIGSLLYTKATISEWESFKDEELSKLKEESDDSIMNTLKLSYEHLPSSLKHCFAYCSLFPKDFEFDVQKLIYLWIAQGYIKPNEEEKSAEEVGRSYFMSLLRRSFFQEAEEHVLGEIGSCKMHDLVHDLAQYVAGEELAMLTTSSSYKFHSSARHVRIDCGTDYAGEILPPVLNMNQLRSFVLMVEDSRFLSALDQQYRSCKCLRALILSEVGIVSVSSNIGELKLLKFLDLSWNEFERLPDSMANLLNLLALDLSGCFNLKSFPDNFRKLINLRYLNIWGCRGLKHMPPGVGEMSCLQYLNYFKVGKAPSEVKKSGLDALDGLHQLRGGLLIEFEHVGIEDKDECSWQLPVSLQWLWIEGYPGIRIPHWANHPYLQLPNLESIQLEDCFRVTHLPPFRYLPYLKHLRIAGLWELGYMETEEESPNAALFFPCLERLELSYLPSLKGWSRNHHVDALSFPLVSILEISDCPELKSIPPSPRICQLDLQGVCGVVIEQLLSSSLKQISISNCKGPFSFPGIALTSLEDLYIADTDGLGILHLASPHLRKVSILGCHDLTSVQVEAPGSLWSLDICCCRELKILDIAHPNFLEKVAIDSCPKLGIPPQVLLRSKWEIFEEE